MQGRGEESQQRGDTLTFIDEIIDENILLVITSAILSVKESRHCTKIPV
jgi:hypothetical protein